MKRYDGQDKHVPKKAKTDKPAANDNQEYMCLLRANFRDEKISAVVHSRDLNKFQTAYCALLRSNIDGLKKTKKVKTKKKATE